MASSGDLLRMLEPVVRPVATPGSRSVAQVPLEERSFESLLADEQQRAMEGLQDPGDPDAAANAAKPVDPLGALGAMDAIENASLLSLMGRGGASHAA